MCVTSLLNMKNAQRIGKIANCINFPFEIILFIRCSLATICINNRIVDVTPPILYFWLYILRRLFHAISNRLKLYLRYGILPVCEYHFSPFSLRETYPFVLDENSKKIQERSIIPSILPSTSFDISFWRFLERE